MAGNLLATKPIENILAEANETSEHSLKRALGPINLITLGIGAHYRRGHLRAHGNGSGAVRRPAIVISYIIAGIGCVFAGLCYAEFASMIPIAGSAYTYGYATMGEIVAWIIGWALVLEYAFGAATVAVGWSGFVSNLVELLRRQAALQSESRTSLLAVRPRHSRAGRHLRTLGHRRHHRHSGRRRPRVGQLQQRPRS